MGDAHASEYLSAADKRIEWLTGFTGSAPSGSERILSSARVRRIYLWALRPGSRLSDEPGSYMEGALGIRLESDLVIEPATTRVGWDAGPYLRFRYLTPVPFCRALIELELLNAEEIAWIDDFHSRCRAELSVELLALAAKGSVPDDEAAIQADVAAAQAWLARECAPLQGPTPLTSPEEPRASGRGRKRKV